MFTEGMKVGDYAVGTRKTGVPNCLTLYRIKEIELYSVIVEEVDTEYIPLNKGKLYRLNFFDLDKADPNSWKDESWEIKKTREAEKYLNSTFAKHWLKEMRYTEKIDEYGHKEIFLSILPGYKKISDKSFQRLCNAICWVTFHDKLRMGMWIGGKVDWTMFYQRPDHVDGHETYFCGVVAKDDFSPEDWEKDHSDYAFESVRY